MESITKALPLKGELFKIERCTAFLIPPKSLPVDSPTPWLWYAPALLPEIPDDLEEWMFQRFLSSGIAVAGLDVGESYGSPAGRVAYTTLYRELVEKRGFSKRPCLLARSRGGLMLYNWAAENPTSLACIVGIYAVCNLSSYPGLERACGAYGLTKEQLAAQLPRHNPIDRLAPLAQARVPIFHIHGDSDVSVPLEDNSGELAKRYLRAGGQITLIVAKGQGHTSWDGYFRCQELVDFVIAHAQPGLCP